MVGIGVRYEVFDRLEEGEGDVIGAKVERDKVGAELCGEKGSALSLKRNRVRTDLEHIVEVATSREACDAYERECGELTTPRRRERVKVERLLSQ